MSYLAGHLKFSKFLEKYGKSKAELLRIALALFFAAEKEESQGKAISVTKDGTIEKEFAIVK